MTVYGNAAHSATPFYSQVYYTIKKEIVNIFFEIKKKERCENNG